MTPTQPSLSRRTFLRAALPLALAPFNDARPGTDETSSEGNGAAGLKLLFSGPEDIADPWGRIHFGATPMKVLRTCEPPGFTLACCLPRSDGTWEVFGQDFQRGKEASMFEEQHLWKLLHATTRDGCTFEHKAVVHTSAPGPWTDHLGLAYNPDRKEYLALKLLIDKNGFGYRAYFSPDGRQWREHSGNPLFYDCDSLGLFWSPRARRFVCTNKTLQPFPKRIRDHGGTHPQNKDDNLRDRRVLAIRSSPDGRSWQPADSMMDVWNQLGKYRALPAQHMTVPDEDDPPDLEHYRGIGFWYHDRAYMVVLNYAASPLLPNKHGPQLDTEWWVSRDGLRWERPFRGINALGEAFPASACISHNPMVIGGKVLFHFGNRLVGMEQDRISFLGARANAEFSSLPFTMPAADLLLNAAIPSLDRAFAAGQAYVMAGVADEGGQVLPGWEARHCLFQRRDGIDLPLLWQGRSARELAGRRIRLRFHLRGANLYAVTAGKT